MVSSSPRFRPAGVAGRVRAGVAWLKAMVRKQFITENRRLAFVLALVTVAVAIAAVHVSVWWFSPGVMILPILAGGLLLLWLLGSVLHLCGRRRIGLRHGER